MKKNHFLLLVLILLALGCSNKNITSSKPNRFKQDVTNLEVIRKMDEVELNWDLKKPKKTKKIEVLIKLEEDDSYIKLISLTPDKKRYIVNNLEEFKDYTFKIQLVSNTGLKSKGVEKSIYFESFTSKLIKDIDYFGNGNKRQMLDIYLPKNIKDKKLPLIIYLHPGGFVTGDKTWGKSFALKYNKLGFAVVTIAYRFLEDAYFPAQNIDVKTALLWIKNNEEKYMFDSNNIGVYGISAGGYLSTFLATTIGVNEKEIGNEKVVFTKENEKIEIRYAIILSGLTEFLQLDVKQNNKRRKRNDNILGKMMKQKPDLAKILDARTFIDGNEPHFLIFHTTKDKLVPIVQADILYKKLKQENPNKDIRYERYDEAGHGLDFMNEMRYKIIEDFILEKSK